MVDKHKPEQVLKSYNQKQAARLRKQEREAARQKAFQANKDAWELNIAWLRLAHFGFYLACLVALVAMAAFVFFVMVRR